jgi:hypothetical protein
MTPGLLAFGDQNSGLGDPRAPTRMQQRVEDGIIACVTIPLHARLAQRRPRNNWANESEAGLPEGG